jgi:hypothetical protein
MKLYILSFKQEISLILQTLNLLCLLLHYILATVSLDRPQQQRQKCSIKKVSEKNLEQLFKWGFFKKEGHLVYRFTI